MPSPINFTDAVLPAIKFSARGCLLPIAIFLAFLSSCPATAQSEPSRQDVISRYQRAVDLAGELNVYGDDMLQIVPKIRMASNLMMNGNYEKAALVLDGVLSDLELIQSQRPRQFERSFRLEWLEIYREIIQKYAILALLAFFLARAPYFLKMFRSRRVNAMGKLYLTILTIVGALFFAFFDVSRYGESAWAFFDIQVVFLTLGGLLGGVWAGFFSGALIGLFRWILSPGTLVYVLIAMAAGLAGGFGARWLTDYQKAWKAAALTGLCVGLVHGLLIYVPMAREVSWTYSSLSVVFLTILEGGAVFVFMAVVSGVVGEENRRAMEHELLQTKLLFLQAQISPHFLFNALNTISAICHREQAREARRLILSLADFFRRALKRVDDKITLREEMGYIESYLELEKARFQERLRVDKIYEITDALWEARIPFLVLQPLVENAIKHGISKKEAGGTLTIRLREESGCLVAQVSDEGPGADPGRIHKILEENYVSADVGIGLQNIHQRLQRLYGRDHGLHFQCAEGRGMMVEVRIPLSLAGITASGRGEKDAN